MPSDVEKEPGVLSIGAGGGFLSIGVVTKEQAESEDPTPPDHVAIYNVVTLPQLISTLSGHLNQMMVEFVEQAVEEHSEGQPDQTGD